MRVLWNNHRDVANPGAGGDARTIHEVSRRLVARGHQVTLLTTRMSGMPSESEIDGVRIVRYPGNVLPHFVLPIVASSKFVPDVIVDDMSHAVPWLSPWVTSHPGIVFFRHLHARTLSGQVSPPLAGFLTAIEKRYSRLYQRWPFVTESQRSVDDLISIGVPRDRCVRIPPGVDLQEFQPREKYDTPTIVYFGGFRDYKRPEHAIYLLKELLRRGWEARLVMVGGGTNLSRTERVAEGLGLSNSVQFRGRLKREHLAEVVARSWVNIHCSVHEGWGLSIMEAAAAGTPTVAYDVPGVNETVRNGSTGFLGSDLDSLVGAAESIMASPNEWAVQCRSWASQFKWEDTTDSWEHALLMQLRSS